MAAYVDPDFQNYLSIFQRDFRKHMDRLTGENAAVYFQAVVEGSVEGLPQPAQVVTALPFDLPPDARLART